MFSAVVPVCPWLRTPMVQPVELTFSSVDVLPLKSVEGVIDIFKPSCKRGFAIWSSITLTNRIVYLFFQGYQRIWGSFLSPPSFWVTNSKETVVSPHPLFIVVVTSHLRWFPSMISDIRLFCRFIAALTCPLCSQKLLQRGNFSAVGTRSLSCAVNMCPVVESAMLLCHHSSRRDRLYCPCRHYHSFLSHHWYHVLISSAQESRLPSESCGLLLLSSETLLRPLGSLRLPYDLPWSPAWTFRVSIVQNSLLRPQGSNSLIALVIQTYRKAGTFQVHSEERNYLNDSRTLLMCCLVVLLSYSQRRWLTSQQFFSSVCLVLHQYLPTSWSRIDIQGDMSILSRLC